MRATRAKAPRGAIFLLAALGLGIAATAPAVLAKAEAGIKIGFVLNKGDLPFFSWVLIQESNYFIKDIVSFGYETQFSYYKVKPAAGSADPEITNYPINVFFNSKVRILTKGVVRPYAGAGYGFMSSIKGFPDHFEWEKSQGFQGIVGVSVGMEKKAALQIELRVLATGREGDSAKFLLAGGIAY
jgi:hypothetical protein